MGINLSAKRGQNERGETFLVQIEGRMGRRNFLSKGGEGKREKPPKSKICNSNWYERTRLISRGLSFVSQESPVLSYKRVERERVRHMRLIVRFCLDVIKPYSSAF